MACSMPCRIVGVRNQKRNTDTSFRFFTCRKSFSRLIRHRHLRVTLAIEFTLMHKIRRVIRTGNNKLRHFTETINSQREAHDQTTS